MARLVSEDANKHHFAGLREKQFRNSLSAAKRYFLASALVSRAIHGMVRRDEDDLRPALAMTKEATGKVGRVYHGLPHFAEVTVQVTESLSEPSVLVRCSGDRQPAPQGYVEDVPAEGYNDWKQGAVIGANFALEVAGLGGLNVVITRILGLTTDTNPTVVGAATIYAVWQALDYPATQEQAKQIVDIVSVSWQHSADAMPDFHISA